MALSNTNPSKPPSGDPISAPKKEVSDNLALALLRPGLNQLQAAVRNNDNEALRNLMGSGSTALEVRSVSQQYSTGRSAETAPGVKSAAWTADLCVRLGRELSKPPTPIDRTFEEVIELATDIIASTWPLRPSTDYAAARAITAENEELKANLGEIVFGHRQAAWLIDSGRAADERGARMIETVRELMTALRGAATIQPQVRALAFELVEMAVTDMYDRLEQLFPQAEIDAALKQLKEKAQGLDASPRNLEYKAWVKAARRRHGKE